MTLMVDMAEANGVENSPKGQCKQRTNACSAFSTVGRHDVIASHTSGISQLRRTRLSVDVVTWSIVMIAHSRLGRDGPKAKARRRGPVFVPLCLFSFLLSSV
jgi:hypothetical protein